MNASPSPIHVWHIILLYVTTVGCVMNEGRSDLPLDISICELANYATYRRETLSPPNVLVRRFDIRDRLKFEALEYGNCYAPGVATLIVENCSGREIEIEGFRRPEWSLCINGRKTTRTVPLLWDYGYLRDWARFDPQRRFAPYQKRAFIIGMTEFPNLLPNITDISVAYRRGSGIRNSNAFHIPCFDFDDFMEGGWSDFRTGESEDSFLLTIPDNYRLPPDSVNLELFLPENAFPFSCDSLMGAVFVARCDEDGAPLRSDWNAKYVYGIAVLLATNVSNRDVYLASFSSDAWTFRTTFKDGTSDTRKLLVPAWDGVPDRIRPGRKLHPGQRISVVFGFKSFMFRFDDLSNLQVFYDDGVCRMMSDKLKLEDIQRCVHR